MIQAFVFPAVSFGLSAAVIPGPLIAYLVNTTLTQGWRKALLVVLAPLVTDAPIIILMTFILGQLPSEILRLIQVGGGLLLLSIAWGARTQYQSAAALNLAMESDMAASHCWSRVLLTGVMMNFLSPGPYLFWASINGPLLVEALEISSMHAFAFLLAFYGTFLSGLCGWVLAFHYVRHISVRYLRFVIMATVLLLLWFAIGFITAAFALEAYQPPIVVIVLGAVLAKRFWSSR